MSNFLRIQHTKNYQNRLIFDRVIHKIKRWTFLGTQGGSRPQAGGRMHPPCLARTHAQTSWKHTAAAAHDMKHTITSQFKVFVNAKRPTKFIKTANGCVSKSRPTIKTLAASAISLPYIIRCVVLTSNKHQLLTVRTQGGDDHETFVYLLWCPKGRFVYRTREGRAV